MQGCLPPVSLTYTNIQAGSVLLQWDAVPSAISYTLRYRKQGGTSWMSLNVAQNYRSITNLSPTTVYEWIVRANCINVGPGGFSPINTFTAGFATPPCTRPTGVTLINLQRTDAGLTWDSQPGATYYEVQYRKTLGGNWITIFASINTTFFTGLTPGTIYSARIRARCGEYDTPWSGVVSFQTPMAKMATEATFNEVSLLALSLYPNPSKGIFTLHIDNFDGTGIPVQIIDMTGRTLITQSIDSTETTFDLSNYAKGVYVVKIADKTARVIVE